MQVTIQLLLLALALVISGCATNKEPKYAELPGLPTPDQPVVKPANVITGKVASYNAIGRFVVLNFPLTQMATVGQTLFLYRDGLKVGEVKISGPQKDDNIVADLVKGEAAAGDDVRDR
jgi:hypothetical protein